MDKIYEYKGKHYCETDISHRDDDYAGSLYDLYWELRKENRVSESTVYYTTHGNKTYNESEELIEEEFSNLVIGESTKEDIAANNEWRKRMMQES